MPLTIDIPDDLAARAAAAGFSPIEVSHLAVAGIAAALDAGSFAPARGSRGMARDNGASKPQTGAELIARLAAAGLLTGYGEPNVDSLDLAKQLRRGWGGEGLGPRG